MNKFYVFLLICIGAVAISSCSKSSNPTSTNNNNGADTTSNGTMKITVDGTAYVLTTATAHTTATSGLRTVTVAGADNVTGRGCGFTLTNISGVGTYDIATSFSGSTPQVVFMTYEYKDASGNSVSFASPNTGASVGKITITEMSTTTLKATFNGTLTNTSGSGTTTITNGIINATFY